MFADITVTANDVARAERRVQDLKRAWERHRCRSVSREELNEAENHIEKGEREISQFYSLTWKGRQVKFRLLWLTHRTGVTSSGWFAGSVLVGTVAVALAVVPLMILFGRITSVFLGLAICFFLASGFAALGFRRLSGKDLGVEVGTLRTRLATRLGTIAKLKGYLHDWQSHLVTLRDVRRAQADYVRAVERHRELVDLLNNRRYRLAHSDWRSLRGVPFENFIAEIFEELGYTVTKTKTTGDQGVDLIVTGKGRRIAVQTKGYKGSVGNTPVQEVYAGMAHYRCTESVAITNSSFTSGALSLARSVGCTLIEGRNIPRLIEGDLF